MLQARISGFCCTKRLHTSLGLEKAQVLSIELPSVLQRHMFIGSMMIMVMQRLVQTCLVFYGFSGRAPLSIVNKCNS